MAIKIYQKKRTKTNAVVWDHHRHKGAIFKVVTKKNPVMSRYPDSIYFVYGNGRNYYYMIDTNRR